MTATREWKPRAACLPRAAAVVILAAGVTACSSGSPTAPTPTPGGGAEASMRPSDWQFRYSPGMPAHPSSATDGGWQFAFPSQFGVEYLTTSQRPASASESITASFSIDASGEPFFEYRTEPENTCGGPATVRLFFQRRGDNMTGDGAYEFYRWWSNPVAAALTPGSVTLTGDLTDPSQWSSVLGRHGDENPAMFHAALADLGDMGFTFGGGCFFGHGVYVIPGTGQAVFKATSYVVR